MNKIIFNFIFLIVNKLLFTANDSKWYSFYEILENLCISEDMHCLPQSWLLYSQLPPIL